MDRLTRKELKTDKFALEVEHGVEYVAEHRKQVTLYSAIVAGVVVLALAGYFIHRYQVGSREDALRAALKVQDAQVGGGEAREGMLAYPTQAEKTKAVQKALNEVADKYSGTAQGEVARYFVGTNAADKGDLATAQKSFEEVIAKGDSDYASLAKVALAPIYKESGKVAEGEKLLRSLIDSPTTFVSKESATIELADYLASTRPAEARKLLEPLRSDRGAISRAALASLNDLPKN